MKKNLNILFDNPAAAAKHLNKVWDNVNIWWESNRENRSSDRSLGLPR